MLNIETKEVRGDDSEYKKNTDELLGKVVSGEIKTYILVALDDGDVGTVINLEGITFEDCLKLEEAMARVVAKLRHAVNNHLANMSRENYLLGKAMALHFAGMDLQGMIAQAKKEGGEK